MATEQSRKLAAQAWCTPNTQHIVMQPELAEEFAIILDNLTAKQAMDILRKAMNEDPDYAWSWHCNIAMVAFDAGAPHKEANERAAGFMRNAFDVDTSTFPVSRT